MSMSRRGFLSAGLAAGACLATGVSLADDAEDTSDFELDSPAPACFFVTASSVDGQYSSQVFSFRVYRANECIADTEKNPELVTRYADGTVGIRIPSRPAASLEPDVRVVAVATIGFNHEAVSVSPSLGTEDPPETGGRPARKDQPWYARFAGITGNGSKPREVDIGVVSSQTKKPVWARWLERLSGSANATVANGSRSLIRAGPL